MKQSDILKIRDSKIFVNNISEDIKILSAGDFHINSRTKEEDIEFYLDNVNKEKPDYIFLLGDLLDNPVIDNKTYGLLNRLVKGSGEVASTYIILGNHDFINKGKEFINKDLWDSIDNINNVHLLNDKLVYDNRLVIMGYTQKLEAYYNSNRDTISDSNVFYSDFIKKSKTFSTNIDLPKIMLIHSPEYIIEKRNQELLKDYDLIICGHYHNGCVPPILDKLWNSNRGFINARRYLFPSNVRGIQQLDYNYLIYNGGWVKLSKSTTKGMNFLDNMFNRQIDITTLTNNPMYKEIEVKQKYKVKHKNIF